MPGTEVLTERPARQRARDRRRASLRPAPLCPFQELPECPPLTRYTKDHEWVRLDGDIATIGITAYAAEQLGDVVFVELPKVGRR